MEEIKVAYRSLVKVLGFKCLGCTKCDYPEPHPDPKKKNIIPLMNEEIEMFKEKGKMYGVVLYKRIHGIGGHVKFDKTNRCIFLTKDNKCDIHDYKPLVCYIHPFQVFTVGLVFGGGMIFDTKCSWVKKHRKRLDNPSGKVRDAYNYFYQMVMKYKIEHLHSK